MENYETIADVIKDAANSEGSAAEENLKYLDSMEGKISQLENASQQFWYDFLNSDLMKQLIDLATNLLNILDKIVGKTGVLKITLSALAIEGVQLLSKGFKSLNSGGRAKK